MKIHPRRPYDENALPGYMESDLDYVHNNLAAAVALLDQALTPPPAKGDPMLDHVLKVENPEFNAWRETLPSKYWARYDLSACRIGYEAAMTQMAPLRAFAQALFSDAEWPHGGDIDGWTFQDLAVKHGLLEPVTVTVPCGSECACAEYHSEEDMAEGVTCYHKTQLLLGTKETPCDSSS